MDTNTLLIGILFGAAGCLIIFGAYHILSSNGTGASMANFLMTGLGVLAAIVGLVFTISMGRQAPAGINATSDQSEVSSEDFSPSNENTSTSKSDENGLFSGFGSAKVESLLDVCPPYEYERGYNEYMFDTFQMTGKEFSNGFTLNAYWSGTVLFNLEGKYKTLQFDMGHVDGSSKNGTFTLEIYLDSKKVEAINMNYDELVKHHEISLNKASQLKLVFYNSPRYENATYGFANVKIS